MVHRGELINRVGERRLLSPLADTSCGAGAEEWICDHGPVQGDLARRQSGRVRDPLVDEDEAVDVLCRGLRSVCVLELRDLQRDFELGR